MILQKQHRKWVEFRRRLIDKIGEVKENPFEGSPNDIPIAALSRTIEIDLRDMLRDDPYGGSFENRIRFLLETVKEIRKSSQTGCHFWPAFLQ